MLTILSATTPIFLTMAVGYFATRFGLFTRADMAIFGRLVTKIVLPCLIFLAVSSRSLSEILNPTYLAANALGSILMFALAFGYARLRRHRALKGTFIAMSVGCVNDGFVGLPLFLIVVPTVGSLAVGMDMIVDNIILLPLGFGLLAHLTATGSTLGQRLLATVQRLASNPLFMAIVLAVICSALGWRLPVPIEHSVTLLANASTGLALLTVGGMLHGLPVSQLSGDLIAILIGKLLLHPMAIAAVWLGLVALGLPPLEPHLVVALILTGALPSMSIMPALALPYGEGDLTAAAMAATTALSFFTLSGWLLGFQLLGYL